MSISIFRSSFFISEGSFPSSIFVTRCWIFHRIRNLAKISSYEEPPCSGTTFLSMRSAMTLSSASSCKDQEPTDGLAPRRLEDLEAMLTGRISPCLCMTYCDAYWSTRLQGKEWWKLRPLLWYLSWKAKIESWEVQVQWACEDSAFGCILCLLEEMWLYWLQIQRVAFGWGEEHSLRRWSDQPCWRLRR